MGCEKHGYANNVYCPACDLEQVNAMTDIPTPAPTDSAVEPAGVSELDAVIELMQAKVSGAVFNGIKAFEYEPRRILAVLLAARQQLAEMRGLLVDAEALLCDERGGIAANELASRICTALASPSQPERGKCEHCNGVGRVHITGVKLKQHCHACNGTGFEADCAQPEREKCECRLPIDAGSFAVTGPIFNETCPVHGKNSSAVDVPMAGAAGVPVASAEVMDCAQGGSPADPERQASPALREPERVEVVAGLRSSVNGLKRIREMDVRGEGTWYEIQFAIARSERAIALLYAFAEGK